MACRVTTVGSGDEAVKRAAEAEKAGEPYKVAILDWKMPGLDGVGAAERLGRGEGAPKVILVTAYDWDEATKSAEKAGVSLVLHKPISPSTLHDAVLHVLQPTMRSDENPRRPAMRQFAPGQRVLLVEDHPINRELARELLGQAGLGVSEATNGLEALDLLGKESFDAVLMDVQMPMMDGLEAVRAIRAQEAWKRVPVVAMTAHAMLGDRERFLDAGMSDYIAKPIEEEELHRVLARWLRVAEAAPREAAAAAAAAASAVPAALHGFVVEEGLRRAGGNAELYRRLVAAFVRDVDGLVPRLAACLEGEDVPGALHILHTLKGTAATAGARRVAEEAASLEAALKRAPRAKPSLAALGASVDEVLKDRALLEAPAPAAFTGVPAPLGAAAARDALPVARRLLAHVKESNLAASTTFQELKAVLEGGLPREIGELEAALDILDFEAAGKTTEALARSLESAAGAA
jgi:two-component system sensor histidine kinase/response regulator